MKLKVKIIRHLQFHWYGEQVHFVSLVHINANCLKTAMTQLVCITVLDLLAACNLFKDHMNAHALRFGQREHKRFNIK